MQEKKNSYIGKTVINLLGMNENWTNQQQIEKLMKTLIATLKVKNINCKS